MKNEKLFILGMLLLSVNAFAGNEKGNGGDICENRIIDIRNDIKQWIEKGESKQLHLPPNITLKEYNSKMLAAIKQTTISCTNRTLSIGKSDKTCINSSMKQENTFLMECNFTRFQNTDESNQYKLVYHEYAGVAGFEINDGNEESKYDTSNQVTGYLKNQVIKKLVIASPKKVQPGLGINFSEVLEFQVFEKYFLRLDEIEKRLDLYEQNKSMVKEKIHEYVDKKVIPQLLFLKSEYSVLEGESINSKSKQSYRSIQKAIDLKIAQIKNEMEKIISQVDLTENEQRIINLFIEKKTKWEKKLVLVEDDASLLNILRESEYKAISEYDEENSINYPFELKTIKERINKVFSYKENFEILLWDFNNKSLLSTDVGAFLELPNDCLKEGGWGWSEYNFSLQFSNIDHVKLLIGTKDQGPISMKCSRGFKPTVDYNSKERSFNIKYTKKTSGSIVDVNVNYQYPDPSKIFQALEKDKNL